MLPVNDESKPSPGDYLSTCTDPERFWHNNGGIHQVLDDVLVENNSW